MSVSTGIGYDAHRFADPVAERLLILGGVEIAHDRGLEGWSDADVVTHAVIDALLGAAGLGDIGEHFPDTDERWRDADSIDMLRTVAAQVQASGSTIHHVDLTVMLETPKLGPHKDEIRRNLAGVLGLAPMHVNVKATRGEGMGFVGRGEGAAALAIATVERT